MREFSHKGLYPFVTDRPLQDYNPKNRGILSILNLEIGDLQKKEY